MNSPSATRDRLQAILDRPGRGRAFLWLVAPLLCLALPGLGVILAFLWVSSLMWLGRQPLASLGLHRQVAWPRTLALAAALAVAVSVLSNGLLEPLVRHVVGQAADLSRMDKLTGNGS